MLPTHLLLLVLQSKGLFQLQYLLSFLCDPAAAQLLPYDVHAEIIEHALNGSG